MDDRNVLQSDGIACARRRQYIVLRNDGRLVVVGEEVAAADLVFVQVVVHFRHALVFGLHDRGPGKGDLPPRAVGQGHPFQKVIRNRVDAAGWNRIIR